MDLDNLIGAIALYIDGEEIEVVDLSVSEKTGNRQVKTMRKTGIAGGRPEYTMSLSVVIPATGDLDWSKVKNAKLTIFPDAVGGKKTSYTGFCVTDISEKYSVDNEARRDVQGFALSKKEG